MALLLWFMIVGFAMEKGTASSIITTHEPPEADHTEESTFAPMPTESVPVAQRLQRLASIALKEPELPSENQHLDTVLFSAYTTAENSNDYNMDKVVSFAGTSVNLGDGYDSESSQFFCPTSGYYEFSVTMSGVNGGLGVAIMCDEEVVSPLAFSTESGAISTNTIILCKEGQKVYTQVKLQYGVGLPWNTLNGLSMSGFSGKLLAVV